ncbi:MAG: phosphoribosylformylglycinamidine synthase I [Acidimicrobiia bacterium]|nr:phosphoribosylformylglycinamidine synthase I [Acidimicrobiia bacterium]
MKPRVIVLHATGTNRDREAAWAIEMAGGEPEIIHINALRDGDHRLAGYQMLLLPGGFSYGDDLGAGKLWAVGLRHRLGADLEQFVADGKPVLGICNGFQALIKSGLLPGSGSDAAQQATLTRNASAHFECRWVQLAPEPDSRSVFLNGDTENIFCPVAHGEGRFVADPVALDRMESEGLVALRYAAPDGQVSYPANPNGSMNNVAGITNPAGTILGLMPHPEDHIVPGQHPQAHRGEVHGSGLPLFRNGVNYASHM